MRYEDAAEAIRWLCEAFQFEEKLVVPGDGNSIDHAQLILGNGMVMLSSMRRESDFDTLMTVPAEIGGRETVSIYIIVEDVDAHHLRAKAAGAEIVLEPKDEAYGGRVCTCKDPEGHVWSFGNYDAFAT